MLGEIQNVNAKRTLAFFAVFIMAVSAVAVVSSIGYDAEDEKPELKPFILSGTYIGNVTYNEDQTLIINGDLTIKDGGTITVDGELIVNEGVTVTIEGSGSQLIIHGDATINGNIISKTGNSGKEGLVICPQDYHDLVSIKGSIKTVGVTSGSSIQPVSIVNNACDNVKPEYQNQRSRVVIDGEMFIGTGVQVTMTNVTISEGASFTNGGLIGGNVDLFGNMKIDGSVLSTGFTISIASTKATISVIELSGDNPITITDKCMYVYDYGDHRYYIEDIPLNSPYTRQIAESYDADNLKFGKVVANKISIKSVKNLKITETVSTGMAYDTNESENKMYADTCMSIGPVNEAGMICSSDDTGAKKAIITISNGKTIDLSGMTLIDARIVIEKDASVEVSGDLVAKASTAGENATITVSGKLSVSGSMIMSPEGVKINTSGYMTSAMYTTESAEKITTYHYTTLEGAINENAKKISILGTLTVKDSIIIPSGIKIITDSNADHFDSLFNKKFSVIVKESATFTLADGSSFTFGGNVAVQGTFIIENINSGINLDSFEVFSDIRFKTEAYLEHTNLVSAIGKVKSGDNVSIFNPVSDYGALVDSDVTVPEGVTLTVPEKKGDYVYKIAVINGCILGVEGTLDVESGAIIHQLGNISGAPGNGWSDITSAPKEGKLIDYSVLMIGDKGTIRSVSKMEYEVRSQGEIVIKDSYRVAGAYYQDEKGLYCISNIPFAFSKILDAKDLTVNIFGTVSITDQTVTGADKKRFIIIFKTGSDVSMNGFRISLGKVIAEAGTTISGDIGTTRGSIEFGKTQIPSDSQHSAVFEDKYVGDAFNISVSGTFVSEDDASVSGTVYVSGNSDEYDFRYCGITDANGYIPVFTVNVGCEMFVYDKVSLITENSELIVKGVLTLYNNGHLSSYILSVLGTLDVSNKDGKISTADITNLLVGGTMDSFEEFVPVTTNGESVVIGNGGFEGIQALYLFAGSSIMAEVLESWINTALYTEFYIDESLWMTVYVVKFGIVEIAKSNGQQEDYQVEYKLVPSLYNRLFKSWQTYNSKTKTYADIKPMISTTVGEYEKVYASLKDDIYTIMVVASAGITDVFLDGVIMAKSTAENTFTTDVRAGSHTFTYNLASGYEGEASIKAIDGKLITGAGLTFEVNDDVYDKDRDVMVIQLFGVKKATPEDPQPKYASNLANFLLMILIGIVVIIAIIVFVRMRAG